MTSVELAAITQSLGTAMAIHGTSDVIAIPDPSSHVRATDDRDGIRAGAHLNQLRPLNLGQLMQRN